MARLRGHHLICLHFFNGKGYDAEFIAGLGDALGRAAMEDVEVVTGPDDVCNRCPHLRAGRCVYTDGADEEIAAMDRTALDLLGVSSGSSVSWEGLRRLIPKVFSRWHKAHCGGCDWRCACEESLWFKELNVRTCES